MDSDQQNVSSWHCILTTSRLNNKAALQPVLTVQAQGRLRLCCAAVLKVSNPRLAPAGRLPVGRKEGQWGGRAGEECVEKCTWVCTQAGKAAGAQLLLSMQASLQACPPGPPTPANRKPGLTAGR